MKELIAIHKLSEQLKLTSRTLRHWEAEGLFTSKRDVQSGWRVYDEEAILRIRVTEKLRRLGIPVADIKTVLEQNSVSRLCQAIEDKIAFQQAERLEGVRQESRLLKALAFIQQQTEEHITDCSQLLDEMEEITMGKQVQLNPNCTQVRFVTLPPMRTVFHLAVGVSPEDEAIRPVLEWIKLAGLMGTVRLFGGNVKPMPKKEGQPYGYGMCATIPDGIPVPEHLKEMTLPGGVFAMMAATDDIAGSWKALMRGLAADGKYGSDRSRLCLEEHIRNDKPSGCGCEYDVILLEPVKLK